ncbi:MAG: tRNA (guanosine(37)-N1)-methyltransferase TrmD [Defluviitaleaceae bacterium]|nr:tRNA (guanosine(37)-N1)-methyltransferase TrmD [Defluviitaleaceae bacterium]
MTFHILTLFPEMVKDAVRHSILGRAAAAGLVAVNTVNIRDFAVNKHGQVDDAPYGGGAGMVMMAQPVFDAHAHVLEHIRANIDPPIEVCQANSNHPPERGDCDTNLAERFNWCRNIGGAIKNPRVIYLSPQGRVLTQKMARELSAEKELILICGHYEGLDERVIEEIVTDEISIGDYILTGGEPAAIVLVDAVSRLIPGVLGKEESFLDESFSQRQDGSGGETANLLEYPHYTRPSVFRGREVPEILLSGNHGKIEQWRREQSLVRTRQKRPDLL